MSDVLLEEAAIDKDDLETVEVQDVEVIAGLKSVEAEASGIPVFQKLLLKRIDLLHKL